MKRVLAAICAVLCLLALSACNVPSSLNLPELAEFEQELQQEYTLQGQGVRSSLGLNLEATIYVDIYDATEESALKIAGKLRKIAMEEGFRQGLLDQGKRWSDAHNWELGERPSLHLRISGLDEEGQPVEYSFRAGYWLGQGAFNSGQEREEYIFDGYATWQGGRGDGKVYLQEDILAMD